MEIKEGYKLTQIGIIPNDWQVKALGEFANVSSGGTPNRSINTYWDGNIPWITTSQIDFNVIVEAKEFITEEGLSNSAAKMFEKGTLLMAMYGQGKTRGKIAILGLKASTNQACAAISLNPGVVKEFVFYNLSSRYDEIRNLSNSGSQENLSGELIKKILIPLPSNTKEQTAIATALFDTDALISSLENLIAKKRNIKQGAMQELLKPKKGWEVKRLGQMAEIRDGTHQTPKYVKHGIPFYSVESVTNNNFENTKFISEEEHSYLTRSYKMEKGDILMTRIGSIGDCKLIDWDVNASFYVSLALLKIRKEYSANFIYHYSKSSEFKKEVELNSLQTAIPKKINLGPISNVKVQLPDIEEQNRIANFLSDLEKEITAIESKLSKYRQIKSGMMQSLLTGKIRLI